MTCYSPLRAYRKDDGGIAFAEQGQQLHSNLWLPCGQCIGCRIDKAHNWAVRCMHEKKMHQWSSFVTLTYDPEHIPPGGCLRYRDFQLFMKRLRKEISPEPVRFYMCGEYGEKNGRPHYHALLFGYRPDDLKYWCRSPSKDNLYRSAQLERLWPYGFVLVGDVNYQSANYVARYCLKKITGVLADEHYRRVDPETGEIYYLPPEFNQMSRKPGIGAPFIAKFHKDVYPSDSVIVRGKEARVPKFYDRWFKEHFPEEFEEVALKRSQSGKAHLEDQTWQRQEVRAEVAAARLTFKRRDEV